MAMTKMVARVAVLAALLVGSAAMPAVAMTDARVSQAAPVEDDSGKPDWLLLGVASITFIVGRTVIQRRIKAQRKSSQAGE